MKIKYWLINKVIDYTYKDKIATITYKSGKIDRFFGESTVWHKLPEYRRCGTMKECFLSDLYTKWMYEKEHLTKE